MKHDVEFIPDEHIYLVDGIIIPSITQLMKVKFGNMYGGVSKAVLNRAAERGTAIHKAIEDYCKQGSDDKSQELHNFKFLCNQYNVEVIDNELTVVIEDDNGEPIGAGTLDLLCKIDGELCVGDIKTTSKLNKEYLFYQLNLYAKAYEQTFGAKITMLFGLHLRGNTRKFVKIPLNWNLAKEILWTETDTTIQCSPQDTDGVISAD